MKRYTFTVSSESVLLEEIFEEGQKLNEEIIPIFAENTIGWGFLKNSMSNNCNSKLWVIYVNDNFDISVFDELKKKYKIEIEQFEDIKKYNGFVFKHNKMDIDEFLHQAGADVDYCMQLDESSETYMLNISRYSDTEIEGYICDDFEYDVEVSDEMVKKFAEKYGFDIVK